MRLFYDDEGPVDQLLQLDAGPVQDGDLISKEIRTLLIEAGFAYRDHGLNCISPNGRKLIKLLALKRTGKSI